MTTVPLTMRYQPTASAALNAWFVPGERADDWLSEIVTWNTRHADLSLRVIPRSRSDRTPIGALVTCEGRSPASTSARCRPYRRCGQRLYLPVEGQLEPAVPESEVASLLPADVVYVWHPVAGLIAFEAGEELAVRDLLQPIEITGADWNCARPGVSFSRRLESLIAEDPPTIAAIMQEGRDDIGSQSDAMNELPPRPGESGSGIGDAIGNALTAPLRGAARFVNWIAGRAPANADRETWVDRVQQWASRVLSPQWQSQRDRELDRLMHMLNENPDLGLKYALPMGGDPGRGIAPPSAHLPPRDVNFRLGSGSGPSDYWDIDAERQMRLITRYRQLAEREVRLGRPRRAAYVYAELLGEYTSAAAVLQAGGCYREAAVLFEERLNRPFEAARCLEEGGLWNEAIERYEKLGEFETVGKLYRKLEQHEQADDAYRKAVEAHRARHDLLAAASLLETELTDTENALSVLRSGWPGSKQAQACLQEEFRLLSRLGRHSEAGKRVQQLREQRLSPAVLAAAATVLADLVRESPDPELRELSADTTRVLVARRLVETTQTGDDPDRRLMSAIEGLEPGDRLLRRDCQRFLRIDRRRHQKRPPSRTTSGISVVHERQLGDDVRWETAVATSHACFVAGLKDERLMVARVGWRESGSYPIVDWRSPVAPNGPILLAPSPNHVLPCWVQIAGYPPLPKRFFGEDVETTVETPPWTDKGTIALAQTWNGVSWTVSNDAGLVVSAYARDGSPILSRQIQVDLFDAMMSGEFMPDELLAVPFHARTEGAFFAVNDNLVSVDAGNQFNITRHYERIKHVSGSAEMSRLRVAVSYAQGGAVHWKDSSAVRRFGDGLYDPLTAFTVSGNLVAVDSSRIEVYRTDRHQVSLVATREHSGNPVAVMPVGRKEFAILNASGLLSIYRAD